MVFKYDYSFTEGIVLLFQISYNEKQITKIPMCKERLKPIIQSMAAEYIAKIPKKIQLKREQIEKAFGGEFEIVD